MDFKDEIIEFSNKIGFDDIGFCRAEIFNDLKEKLDLQQKLKYNTEFQKGTVDERINPFLLLHDAQSIIVCAVAYPPTITNDQSCFSPSSWGRDYHKVLNERMDKLVDFIEDHECEAKFVKVVDTSIMDDRYLAYKAGIGFYGKNNLLISPKLGSYIFLGAIITNLKFTENQILSDHCLSCNKCITTCPTNALDNGILNGPECLSYITQKKGVIEDRYKEKIGNVIYGCDICQTVCPHNKGIEKDDYQDFNPTGVEFPELIEFISISNSEYKKRYQHLAAFWRKRNILRRNALLVIGNVGTKAEIQKAYDIMKNSNDEGIIDALRWLEKKIRSDKHGN